MDREVPVNEYRALVDEIRHHMKLYYDEDTPEISDAEYDALMRRLKQMEKDFPELVTKDSPTQVVGASTKREAGVIVTHNVPMLSIEDVFTKEAVCDWIDEVKALHPDATFAVEQKIDGLSMTLRYENGDLVLAETRGDGLQGEDVTANALVIPDVVRKLKQSYPYLEVRGEVYMRHEDFLKTNERQEAAGKKIFANPRNCAAGTLRQLDARMVKERGLSLFVFNVQDASDNEKDLFMRSHTEGLSLLKEEGMPVAPSYLCSTKEEVLSAIDAIGEARSDLAYDIDGAVVKIDRIAYREDFPAGSKYSAGHIAYKYPPEEKEAVIESVELSVGMTGRINPTAIFTPIRLNGTTVSRATLHNQDFINELGIGIGSAVLVYKSGEIIPKIRAVVKEKTPADIKPYRLPDTCPVCGAKVVKGRGSLDGSADAADMYCSNDDCPAKLERRIINFVSRDAMDMKGFGEEYIKVLIAEGYLKDIADLYTLKDHRDALVEKGLIGKEVNTDKLLQVIEESKKNDLWRLLAGLSVPNVGKTSARTLMRHFKSFDALMNASVEELLEVEDIGDITAQGIADYFAAPAHQAMMKRLKEAGVRMENSESSGTGTLTHLKDSADLQESGMSQCTRPHDSLFSGRTYVVTGDLQHFKNRDALIDYIEERGGKVAGSVSKKTYALINNDVTSTSGKNKKAKELGIPIITEEAVLQEGDA